VIANRDIEGTVRDANRCSSDAWYNTQSGVLSDAHADNVRNLDHFLWSQESQEQWLH